MPLQKKINFFRGLQKCKIILQKILIKESEHSRELFCRGCCHPPLTNSKKFQSISENLFLSYTTERINKKELTSEDIIFWEQIPEYLTQEIILHDIETIWNNFIVAHIRWGITISFSFSVKQKQTAHKNQTLPECLLMKILPCKERHHTKLALE